VRPTVPVGPPVDGFVPAGQSLRAVHTVTEVPYNPISEFEPEFF
jgi:hypothetical protein